MTDPRPDRSPEKIHRMAKVYAQDSEQYTWVIGLFAREIIRLHDAHDALLSDLAEVEVPDLHIDNNGKVIFSFVDWVNLIELQKTMRPLVERAKKFRGTDKV